MTFYDRPSKIGRVAQHALGTEAKRLLRVERLAPGSAAVRAEGFYVTAPSRIAPELVCILAGPFAAETTAHGVLRAGRLPPPHAMRSEMRFFDREATP